MAVFTTMRAVALSTARSLALSIRATNWPITVPSQPDEWAGSSRFNPWVQEIKRVFPGGL
jgi:hypothetical protein